MDFEDDMSTVLSNMSQRDQDLIVDILQADAANVVNFFFLLFV